MRESPGPGAQRNPKTDGGRRMGEGWGSPRARGGWEGSFLTIKCNKSPPARTQVRGPTAASFHGR